MSEETNKSAEVEIIGKAAESSENEIARLNKENDELKARIDIISRDRDNYRGWWAEARAESDKLRNIIKSLIAFTDLA